MFRTLLVTGSAGLLGHALLARAADFDKRIGLDTAHPTDLLDGVLIHQVDLRDASAVIEAFRINEVTHVVHAGAISHPLLLADEPATVVSINVQGTQNVLEAARLAGVKRFVFISSAAVYGQVSPDLTIDESAPLQPDSIYAASKAAAEMLVRGYRAQFGLATVVLRPASIYGPRRQTFSAISYLAANALDGVPSRIGGDSTGLDLIHVDDVARAVHLAVNTGVLGTYTIATGSRITYAQIANTIRRILPGSDIEIEDGGGELGSEGRFNVDAAQRDLGFRAQCELEDGLQQLIDVFRGRPHLRKQARAARKLIEPIDS